MCRLHAYVRRPELRRQAGEDVRWSGFDEGVAGGGAAVIRLGEEELPGAGLAGEGEGGEEGVAEAAVGGGGPGGVEEFEGSFGAGFGDGKGGFGAEVVWSEWAEEPGGPRDGVWALNRKDAGVAGAEELGLAAAEFGAKPE